MVTSIAELVEGSPDRDYSLLGPEAARARENGLVEGEWFRPHVDPAVLTVLTERSNGRAVADLVLWFALLAIVGGAAVMSIGRWWAIPLFVAYGALYGGAADARWHEFGHGTACRSNRINNAVYVVASFMLWRGPTLWRWSHFRHHSDTIIVGRDPEIQIARPPTVRRFVLNYTNLVNGPRSLGRLTRHAAGRIDPEALDFVPESEVRSMVWEARAFVAVLLAVAATSIATTSVVPLLIVGLPTIYGAWLMVLFGATQHLGLREDVLDHRASTRTVHMNPVFRFLYLNMNYHLEHHMFPSVPYHRLPALHEHVKWALPPASPNMVAAYRELIGELWKQRRDPHHELEDRMLPDVPDAADRAAPRRGFRRADGSLDLGPLDLFERSAARRIDVDELTFAVVRLGERDVCVVDGICTHGAAHLADGTVVGEQIECPRHNARFDLRSGAPCRKPARKPLQSHHVTIDCDRIVVHTTTAQKLEES